MKHHFYGDFTAAIRYAQGIAQMDGENAAEYREAADILRCEAALKLEAEPKT